MSYVYILASINRVLCAGSTDDVRQRVIDHKAGRGAAFTKKYRVHRLVYFEVADSCSVAMQRELEIKAWRREKKIALIVSINPEWKEPETPPAQILDDTSEWRGSRLMSIRRFAAKSPRPENRLFVAGITVDDTFA
jgi:putative endonuclease